MDHSNCVTVVMFEICKGEIYGNRFMLSKYNATNSGGVPGLFLVRYLFTSLFILIDCHSLTNKCSVCPFARVPKPNFLFNLLKISTVVKYNLRLFKTSDKTKGLFSLLK